MTIRGYYQCTSCTKNYMVRYGMGDQFPQQVSFFCKDCGEKLVVGYDKKRNLILENLKIISEDNDAEIMTLHPELPIDSSSVSDPSYFATLEFMTKQQKKGDENYIQMRKSQLSVIAFSKGWDDIEKDLRFVKEKRFNLLEEKYGKNHDNIRKKIVKKALEVSRHFIYGGWNKIFDDAYSELEVSRHQTNFPDFKSYLQAHIEIYVDNLYNVMNEYSRVRTEMLITLNAQKCHHEIEGNSSTVEWEKIEMIYGNFYEIYGDLLSIITGINNLNSRGNYALFNTAGFSFQNYIDSDKAGRCNNFIQNPKLIDLSNFYDAGIRNGTHHKNSKIDKDNHEIILGIGKGGRIEKKMGFIEYISYCNELFGRILIMLNLAFKVVYS